MPTVETAGYRGWWPMLQSIGKARDGSKIVKEVYRNMVTGQVHDPGEAGFNGEPPYPTGDDPNLKHFSGGYAENYDRIDWHGGVVAGSEPIVDEVVAARRRFVGNYGHIKWGEG